LSFEELHFMLAINFFVAMGFGGGFVVFIRYVRNNRKKTVLKELEDLSITTGESIVNSIKNVRFKEERNTIFKRFSDQTGTPQNLLQEKYYQTEYCLTPYGYERNGLNIIVSSIVITYIGAFLHVMIKRFYYLGGKVFDDYLLIWPGLVLLILGIILFLIGSYLLETGWKDCSMKKLCKKRFIFLFLTYISTQFIMMLYTLFIVENLFGPWGGLLFPWFTIFLTLYSGSRVFRKIGKNVIVPSTPTQQISFSSIQPSHQQNLPQSPLLPKQHSQPNIIRSKGLIPKKAYEETLTQKQTLSCPYCDEKNLSTSKFCKNCGKLLED
jgi:hypothetical protein